MNKLVRLLAITVSTLLLTACGKQDFSVDDEDDSALIRVSVTPITVVGEQVPYCGTRASQPLMPEYENSIYSLTVLVFDAREGVLRRFPADMDGQQKLYKYINLKDEHGNGLLNTVLSTEDFPVIQGLEYTVCLIANLSEKQTEEMITSLLDNGTVFLDAFKNYKIPIPYYLPEPDDNTELEAGHVRDIYMFGYYQGEVSSHENITISLGRIISRLEIAFTFDSSQLLDDHSFYIRLENLESHAHLFPVGKSPGNHIEQEIHRMTTLEQLNSTIYLYAAPNSALTENEALSLRMWYVSSDTGIEEVGKLPPPNAVVYLCNDQPGVHNRNFQLNRNSVYRFNLNLTTKE